MPTAIYIILGLLQDWWSCHCRDGGEYLVRHGFCVLAASAEGWTWLMGRLALNLSTATTATKRSCSMCPQSCLTQKGTPSRYCNATPDKHTFYESPQVVGQVPSGYCGSIFCISLPVLQHIFAEEKKKTLEINMNHFKFMPWRLHMWAVVFLSLWINAGLCRFD